MIQALVPIALAAGFGLSFTWLVHLQAQDKVTQVQQHLSEATVLAAQTAAEAAAQAQAEAQAKTEARAVAQAADQAAAKIAALPGDAAKGKTLYGTCFACHGKDAEGSKMFKAPRLAGQEPWYIKLQLKKFKDRVRGAHPQDVGGMQMAPMAQLLYNDTAVDDAIAYMATLKAPKPADRGEGNAEAGKEVFQVCVACHGAQAEGNKSQKAPKLTGQHAWYLSKQISNFKEGVRGMHAADAEGKLMGPIAQLLADDEAIDNVIAYIQSLSEE
jgi:cytochrome c553